METVRKKKKIKILMLVLEIKTKTFYILERAPELWCPNLFLGSFSFITSLFVLAML